MKILYQNVRGLRTKAQQVRRAVSLSDLDIFALSETWWNDDFYSHEFFPNDFTVTRRDRSSSTSENLRGGGVCIAVRHKPGQKVFHHIEWESDCIEDIWISITSPAGKALFICLCYIPGITPHETFKTYLNQLADRILSLGNENFIFLGDQNVPNFFTGTPCSKAKLLFDLMDLCELSQFNNVSNRISNTVLDLVFCNCHLSIASCDDPLVPIDNFHPPIIISKPEQLTSSDPKITVFRNWKKANWDSIQLGLNSIDWNLIFCNYQSVDEMVDVFYDALSFVVNSGCPLIVKKDRPNSINMSATTKRLLRKKRKAHAKWRKFNLIPDLVKFLELKLQCEKSADADRSRMIELIEEAVTDNPKKFFGHVQKLRSNGAGVAEFVSLDNETAANELDASNLFAKFFGSTFTKDSPHTSIPSPNHSDFSNCWDSIAITEDTVFNKLRTLKTNKCAGPDGFPPLLFKRCAASLVTPLFLIFTKSLNSGIMPCKWKQAHVVPILKKGSPNNVRNFRPISKLNIVAKLLDSIVADELFNQFKNIISEKQHGFFRRRSTVTNLIGYTEKLQQIVYSGGQVDVIYTDFAKAFDTVSHRVLLAKLSNLGISGSLLNWFRSYLTERSLRVQIGNALSSPVDVTSSVVQGSHCGPLLFSLFINDVENALNVDFNCFADDLKIFHVINSSLDCNFLQNNLNSLVRFANQNGLDLNASKCCVLSFTRKTKNNHLFPYQIGEAKLDRVNNMKDLGVIFDSSLNFNAHIDYACKKARRSLGFIIRNSKEFTNPRTSTILYSSLVRSILEYASQIWSPKTITNCKQIETVQHKFLRFMARKFHGDTSLCLDYAVYERCFKLQPLSLRRIISDVLFTIKSFTTKIDSFSFLHYFRFAVPRLSSRLRQVFHVSGLDSAFDRLMSNFNKFHQDPDALFISCCLTCARSIVEANYIRSFLN